MPAKQILLILRGLIGVTLIALLIWHPYMLSDVANRIRPDSITGMSPIFVAIGQLLVAVFCLKDILVEVVSYPVRNFFGGIFYPQETVIPPPNYNLAVLYREQDRLDEALEVYLGIIKHHPEDVLAYSEGIKAAFDASDPETAAKIAEQGKKITNEGFREHIAKVYEEARAEYEARPEASDDEVLADEGSSNDSGDAND